MELFVPVRLDHAREQLVLTVLARGVADRALLFGQLLVEAQRVIPLKGREVALMADRSVVHASLSPQFAALRGRSNINAGISSPNPVTRDAPCSSSRWREGS